MTILKTTSKMANKLRFKYINGVNIIDMLDIFKVYEHPSKEKIELLYNYIEDIRKNGGYLIKIISYSKFQFTLAYLTDEQEKNYTITYINVITKNNKYKFIK